MNYAIFLDDERYPPRKKTDVFDIWIICRNIREAKAIVKEKGLPVYISFDHDLGENEPTGYDFAQWLIEQDLDNEINIKNIEYFVHSANPVGKKNIEKILSNYLDFKNNNSNNNIKP